LWAHPIVEHVKLEMLQHVIKMSIVLRAVGHVSDVFLTQLSLDCFFYDENPGTLTLIKFYPFHKERNPPPPRLLNCISMDFGVVRRGKGVVDGVHTN
jgi:hypothetical protein